MTESEQLAKHIANYFETRRNKRYGRDASVYEVNWVANLVRAVKQRDERTFRIHHNYAFLVSRPRWREIFATEFNGRLADHELCDRLTPYIEMELSPRTFNNRKGKGASAAINQVLDDMMEVSENFTKHFWIFKFDFKGFFPNALCSYIQYLFDGVIDRHVESEEERDYLHWLTMVCVHSNPAENCELRTPRYLWDLHIPPEKSLFGKPEGVGTPIGRLTSQTGMGMYINDEIKWITEELGLHLTVYVDDGVIICSDDEKPHVLAMYPELRRRLALKGVRLNEKKHYCQHGENGLEFLGSHIRPGRRHVNNKTFNNAIARIKELNRAKNLYAQIDAMVCSVNSYTGFIKNHNDRRLLQIIRETIHPDFWQWLYWSEKKNCLQYKKGYSIADRLNRKYGLRLKRASKPSR